VCVLGSGDVVDKNRKKYNFTALASYSGQLNWLQSVVVEQAPLDEEFSMITGT